MKQLAFAIVFLPVAAFAQIDWQQVSVSYLANTDWAAVSWQIEWDGSIIAQGGAGALPPFTYDGSGLPQIDYISLPNDCVTLTINDANCNGIGPSYTGNPNVFYLTNQETGAQVFTCIGNCTPYACQYVFTFNPATGEECTPVAYCPADINIDGTVGIADLIELISAYGSTCN